MATKKILVVFGATGNQGGSVVNSILSDSNTAKEFKIRGITRDPSKPNAKALEAKGVETVAADTNDKSSLLAAFKGAYAVFAVTNYWEKMDAELEVRQGKDIADAAKVCNFIPAKSVVLLYTIATNTIPKTGGRHPTPNLVLPPRHHQTHPRQIPQSRALRLQSPRRNLHSLPRHPSHIFHARFFHVQLPRRHVTPLATKQRLDPRLAHASKHPHAPFRRR